MSIQTEAPPIGSYNFVLRYYGDIGCEHEVSISSYDEGLLSYAIHCNFDGRRTHTFFIKSENTKRVVFSRLAGWKDVTEDFIREIRSKAIVENLGEEILPETEGSVLDSIKGIGGDASKGEILLASGLKKSDWLPTIRSLLARGLVEKEGVAKHTRYRVTDG